VERFAPDRRDRPPRLPLFARPALSELPRRDFLEIGFDFEHYFLQVFSSMFAIRSSSRDHWNYKSHACALHVVPVKTGTQAFATCWTPACAGVTTLYSP
jgi:hypothetical protein